MEIERFKRIIQYSRENKRTIDSKVQKFCSQLGIDSEKSFHNLLQLVRPILDEKKYLVMELPFKDKEIGAIWYKNDYAGYILLNTSLPEVNVNFALGHELYHVFYHEAETERKIELYMNERYHEHEEELAANLFSSILLMPEDSFKLMHKKFVAETAASTEVFHEQFTVILKLMNYFRSPYMATLVRYCELGLLKDNDGELLAKLMKVTAEEIRTEFSRLWFDVRILDATKKDDFAVFCDYVKTQGENYISEQYLNEKTVKKALENIKTLYYEIRGD